MEKIKATKRGDVVTATIEGEVMKKTLTPEVYETFKANVKDYNAKPTKKLLTAIKKIMTPEKIAKEEKKEEVRNTIKKVEKKTEVVKKANKEKRNLISELSKDLESGKVSASDLSKLEALIAKNKKVEDATPPPTTTSRPYTGEK